MKTPTEAQKLAVTTLGNVLVVAGAGTGKTSTLVQRCVDRIVRERASLEHILMVTFTEAAAAEMRHRIGEALEKARRELPDGAPVSDPARPSRVELAGSETGLPAGGTNAHLEEQLALLDTAWISTLSSFCLELVREHFHELHLDPQLVVLDEDRLAPLIDETLDAIFNEAYGAGNEERATAVRALVRHYGNGSDFAIRKLVLKIHRYTQTLAAPRQWFESQESIFQSPGPSRWREWLADGFADWRALWLPEVEALAGEVAALSACAGALRALPENPSLEQWFAALAAIRAADGDTKLWQRKKSALRPKLAGFFKEAEFLAELVASGGTDPLFEDWVCVRGHMLTLLELVRDFSARFSAAKRELGGLDFADIEQLALQLLTGDGELTPVAAAVRAQFEHVFVDEYQDINAAQDAILRAVSRTMDSAEHETQNPKPETNSGNRFLVGDVKQSIYRFRLAQPKIFTDYDERWSESEEGRRIPLSENFRSREAILNFVNPLFEALMRRSIGGLDYPKDARLVFGDRENRAAFTAGRDGGLRRVELHLIAKSGESDDGGENGETSELLDLEAVEREARLIARRLRELRDSKLVIHEKGGVERQVEYRDMVVLMRSAKDRTEAFAKQFHQFGVPLRAARAGFYDAPEVSDLLGLLQLLDNPLQDLPLLAVLHSPLVALSPEELVEVHEAWTKDGWWPALQRFRARGPSRAADADESAETPASAWRKVDLFLTQFERWRELMLHCPVSQVLEMVLTETHYESLLAADERGAERLANARRFIELARDYDPLRRQGLYRFLRFIEAQRVAEVDREPAPAPADNAVQLMSIHRSKGLEFPVVVLANLGGTFNEQHLNESILLSEEFGLCPKVCPADRQVIYPSLPHWLAKRTERRELLGEEMRLLYVALTRARDVLILAGTTRSRSAAWSAAQPGPVRDAEILKSRSYLDWFQLWLPRVTATGDWTGDHAGTNSLLRWQLYAADDELLRTPQSTEAFASHAPTEFDAPALLASLERPYPFLAATKQAAKSSVSALRRGMEDDDALPLFFTRERTEHASEPGRLSAREIGTAHHRFQQFVSLAAVQTEGQLRAESERLKRAGLLTEEQTGALNFTGLHTFWNSDEGRLVQQHAVNVRREFEFTARFTPAELAALGLGGADGDEFIVMQGVADLVVFLPDELWLLDFKTDVLRPDELERRARHHAPQLALYARALSGIHGKPVTRQWLHFFALGRTVDVLALAKSAKKP